MNHDELNNLPINQLWTVLRKETLPERFWLLVPDARQHCEQLSCQGIRSSVDIFNLVQNEKEMGRILSVTGIEKSYLLALHNQLMFHRFKPTSLSKLTDIDPQYLDGLKSTGITHTGKLLHTCKTAENRLSLSKDTGIPLHDLIMIMGMADLMRKPGVKATKVRLFLHVGIHSLAELGQQEPIPFRKHLQQVIEKTHIVKAVPTPKEVASDIRWARLYPLVSDNMTF